MNRSISSGVATLFLVVAGSAGAVQITNTWTNVGNGVWGTAANWSGGVPNNGVDTHKVIVNGNPGTNVVVTTNGNFTIDQLVIDLADQVIIANNNSLTLATSADLSNAGTLSLSSLGNASNLVIDADISLSGGGTVSLSNNANNQIFGTVGTRRLTNVDNVIQGGGRIGLDSMALTNQAGGVIQANLVSTTLTIDPSASGAINQGILRAINTATLNLNNGTFTNTGGTIEAQTGSTVQLSNATIVGGTLTTAGTGVIRNINAVTLNGVTNSGAFFQNNNTDTTLIGTITNSGAVTMNSAGNLTDVILNGDVDLTGGGTVTLSNNLQNRIFGQAAGDRLTNVNNTIQGSGQIGVNSMAFTNQGTVSATQSLGLTVDPSASGAINTGVMQALGGPLTLQGGTFTNTGGIIRSNPGAVNVNNSTVNGGIVEVLGAGAISMNDGSISGGTLNNSSTGIIRSTTGTNTLGGTVNNVAGGQMIVNNNSVLHLQTGGTYANAGTILMNSAGNITDLVMDGDVTLSGGGILTMSNQLNNRIYGLAAADRLTNADNTIQGSGQIGVDLMALTNQAGGVIQANQAVALTIDPSAGGVINQGILRATNNATLNLNNGTFTNTGGTIDAQTGSAVQLNNATVVGGTLSTAGTGEVRNVNVATLNGVTNLGAFSGNNNTVTTVVGTLTNNGSVALNSAGNLTDFAISGDVTLTGGGVVNLSNNGNNRIYGLSASDRLTNVNNTIQGSGQIGVNQMALTNQAGGLIQANQSTALTIDPGAGGVINQGILRATNNATLNLNNGTFTNAGGIIEAQTGSAVQLNGATVVGGLLTTSGSGVIRNVGTATLNGVTIGSTVSANNNTATTLIGTITNNGGTISLNSAGNLTDLAMSGDVTLTGGGTVNLSNNTNNRIYGLSAADRLTNVNNTIQGSGQIGVNQMALTNQAGGVIQANQSAALTIDPGASGVINQGILRATNNATLNLNNGTFTNAGGIIEAQNGSAVQLSNATVVGGLLTTSGSGVIRNISTATLNGVTIGSTVSANNATTTTLIGTITNGGTISLNSAGNLTDLQMSGDVTLTGGGALTLSNNGNNRIYGLSGANRLTNVNHTIQGSGQIGVNQMGFTNQGTVLANQSTALTINTSSGFTNQGILQSLAGSTLSIIGVGTEFTNFAGTTLTGGSYFAGSGNATTATIQFDNANIVTNQATIDLNGSGARILNRNTLANGIANLTTNGAQGDFTIRNGKNLSTNAAFSNAGAVTVGDLSTLTIGAGAGTMTNTGILDGTGTIVGTVINSGSVNPGSSPGTLTVNGIYNQTVNGALNIEIASLSSFDKLFVLGQALLSGSLNVSLLGGYLPSLGDTFEFMQFAGLTGDFTHFNGMNIGGGLFFREVVSAGSISLVVDSAVAPVPEPGTWLLLGVGLAAIAARRRSRV